MEPDYKRPASFTHKFVVFYYTASEMNATHWAVQATDYRHALQLWLERFTLRSGCTRFAVTKPSVELSRPRLFTVVPPEPAPATIKEGW